MPKSKKSKAQPITKVSVHGRGNATSVHRPRGPALIRQFHTLQTALTTAVDAGDVEAQRKLESELDRLGGLDTYQKASIRGQDKRRGGDSSKVLIEWLKSDALLVGSLEGNEAEGCVGNVEARPKEKKENKKARVLEIGSLSTDNYISRYPKLDVTRIDLNARHPAILQQDFLKRPAPSSEDEQFEGISCSLVLNFVPSSQRSDFLLHLTEFLPVSDDSVTRWLFFVVPAPCVNNSRYMNKTLLLRMFDTLGFEAVREKATDRIAYWLFKRVREVQRGQVYRKGELQRGKTRNNFFISLQT